jgi:hypothetical protein
VRPTHEASTLAVPCCGHSPLALLRLRLNPYYYYTTFQRFLFILC